RHQESRTQDLPLVWNVICRDNGLEGRQRMSFYPKTRAVAGDVAPSSVTPQTLSELQAWIRDTLGVSPAMQTALLAAIDAVFARHERLWQASKDEAIQALAAGFTEQMTRVKTELSARDATVSSISRYFEGLVADLTEKSHRDPKTNLMNFARFTE